MSIIYTRKLFALVGLSLVWSSEFIPDPSFAWTLPIKNLEINKDI